MTLKKQDLQAFRERWRAVGEIETRELQQASIAQHWRQFNAILQMAVALELTVPEDDIGEIITIHQRWQRLREMLL
jgi:hypothetical protein